MRRDGDGITRGNFGRYGIQPLCISYDKTTSGSGGSSSDSNKDYTKVVDGSEPMSRCVAYHTLMGGHFDGELRISIERRNTDAMDEENRKEEDGIILSATLARCNNVLS